MSDEPVNEVRAARLDDLHAHPLKLIEVNGARIVLARVGDAVYACSDTCAHHGGPLSDGKLSGARLACPWHGWMYDVRTGECVMPDRGARVITYAVRVEAGDIWVSAG